MDAITLLKQDHKTVEQLFKQFEKASQPAQQRNLAKRVIEELSVHAAIEEMVFYPAVRDRVPRCWRPWRSITSSNGRCLSSTE